MRYILLKVGSRNLSPIKAVAQAKLKEENKK
nr:MAG TPA: hypothetical protein [Caudoviricetes sp.]